MKLRGFNRDTLFVHHLVQVHSTWTEYTYNQKRKYTYIYEVWNFNSGNYLFTTDTK